MSNNTGKITQVIGPVVDISFETEGSELPNILDALEVTRQDGHKIVLECQQHIGENTIRTVAMESTDGLSRGMEVVPRGHQITMPVGDKVRGRLLNVVGEAIDGIDEISKEGGYQIHSAPQNMKIYLLRQKCYLPVLK
jgi:F-type H+-transporting ATPase subunit beta